MRWFKHLSTSRNDEKLSILVDDLGLEGYGFWWMTLEIIAENSTESSFSVCYSAKKLANFYGTTVKKCTYYLLHMKKLGLISLEKNEKLITLSCPNMAKYRDEYTRRQEKMSGQTPNNVLTDSGQTPDQEYRDREQSIETETEGEKDNTCSEPSNGSKPEPAESSPVIAIPLNKNGSEYHVTESQLSEWSKLYPAVNVEQCLREIRAWNLANPTKRKTKNGVMRHINSWLAKEQNRGGNLSRDRPRARSPDSSNTKFSDTTTHNITVAENWLEKYAEDQ